MKFIWVTLLILCLKPSFGHAEAVNQPLASCEKVSVDDLISITVERSAQYPGMAEVKVVTNQNLLKSISVDLREWRDKNISLPPDGDKFYKLGFSQNGWYVLKFTTTAAAQLFNVNCSVPSLTL